MNKIKILGLSLFSVLVLFTATSYTEDFFEISKNLDIFATLYKEINNYYVDETKPGELMKEGIDAMLSSLDPYTNYIPESDIEDYRFMTTGQYGGIGFCHSSRRGLCDDCRAIRWLTFCKSWFNGRRFDFRSRWQINQRKNCFRFK
jgi:carboxyl-terminal processing protease